MKISEIFSGTTNQSSKSVERRLNDWFIILRSHYDSNKTQRSTRGEWGEIVIGSPFLQVVTGGSEKVGVVMHRWLWVVQGKLGLLCAGGYGWFRGSWGCYEQIRCQWVNVWKFHAIKLKCLHQPLSTTFFQGKKLALGCRAFYKISTEQQSNTPLCPGHRGARFYSNWCIILLTHIFGLIMSAHTGLVLIENQSCTYKQFVGLCDRESMQSLMLCLLKN